MNKRAWLERCLLVMCLTALSPASVTAAAPSTTAVPATTNAARAATPVAASITADSQYEHVWQAQSLFAGEVGRVDVRVIESRLQVGATSDVFSGSLRYHDVIAIADSSGTITSQEALIELVLEGERLGSKAGGPFAGTATLTERESGTVREALAPPATAGRVVVYQVSGHWGANLDGEHATGEILYESAYTRVRDGELRDATWFNRSSRADSDMLGDAQVFSVDVDSADPVDPIDSADSAEEIASGPPVAPVQTPAEARGEGSWADDPGVFDYILKGLRGTPQRDLGTSPPEQVAKARELRDARPLLATTLPGNAVSIDIEYGATYLDAKNHAAELAGGQAMLFEGARVLGESAGFMRGRAPGIPALPSGVDAGQFWAGLGIQSLGDDARVRGAAELAEEFRNVAEGLEGPGLGHVRAATMSTIALARAPFGTVLAGTAASAKSVGTEKLESQADRNAVLAAARDPRAPQSATALAAMERDESADVTPGETELGAFPVAALPASGGPVIHYWGDGEAQQLNPDVWRAYRRDDGTLFWRAGDEGEVAVADASLIGWAHSSYAAIVVSASDVGVVHSYLTGGR